MYRPIRIWLLLMLTLSGICHFNLFLLFLFLLFILLFLCLYLLLLFFFPHLLPMFLTHLYLSYHSYLSASGCSKHTTRQTNRGTETEVMIRARVAIVNMRACHARTKSLLNIKNVARQDVLNASLYNLDRNQSTLISRHVHKYIATYTGTLHYTDVHRSKPARLNL